jgi:transcriptional regulator
MAPPKPEVLQGTLDLMILKTLDALGPLHGFGIARRLEQISDDLLRLNEGTIYTALVRLGQRGWISSSWGTSDNNRKARYYAVTRAGRRQLARQEKTWQQVSGVVNRVLALAPRE